MNRAVVRSTIGGGLAVGRHVIRKNHTRPPPMGFFS